MKNEAIERSISPHTFGITMKCTSGHDYFVPYACSPKIPNVCGYCLKKRSGVILSKLYDKLSMGGYLNEDRRISTDKISMWTFGTDLEFSPEFDWNQQKWIGNDISQIIDYWQRFNTRMKIYIERRGLLFGWKPMFYVVEAGSKGNRLHIHLLHNGYLDFQFVRQQWGEVTGLWKMENGKRVYTCNVNFIQSLDSPSYLAKYTAKSALAYRFLGELFKLKLSKRSTTCKTEIEPEILCNSGWTIISNNGHVSDFDNYYTKFQKLNESAKCYIPSEDPYRWVDRWGIDIDESLDRWIISMNRCIDGTMEWLDSHDGLFYPQLYHNLWETAQAGSEAGLDSPDPKPELTPLHLYIDE